MIVLMIVVYGVPTCFKYFTGMKRWKSICLVSAMHTFLPRKFSGIWSDYTCIVILLCYYFVIFWDTWSNYALIWFVTFLLHLSYSRIWSAHFCPLFGSSYCLFYNKSNAMWTNRPENCSIWYDTVEKRSFMAGQILRRVWAPVVFMVTWVKGSH